MNTALIIFGQTGSALAFSHNYFANAQHIVGSLCSATRLL